MAKKKIKWNKWNRVIHYWGALACALPLIVVIISGILLQLKKESNWIQPSTQRGSGTVPIVEFAQVLEKVKSVPEADIKSWEDIKLLDVRPSKGVIKVRAKNRWEIQLDATSCEVLQVAFRRSDIIEALHDGSFFHDSVKLAIFLPSAIILLILWVTGMYLFVSKQVLQLKRKSKKKITHE